MVALVELRLQRQWSSQLTRKLLIPRSCHSAHVAHTTRVAHVTLSSCIFKLAIQALHCVLSFLSTPHYSGHPCFFHVLTHITSLIILLNNYNVQVNLSGRCQRTVVVEAWIKCRLVRSARRPKSDWLDVED